MKIFYVEEKVLVIVQHLVEAEDEKEAKQMMRDWETIKAEIIEYLDEEWGETEITDVWVYAQRLCSECWKGMKEWYCIDWWEAYYCSDECLHKHITADERDEMDHDEWDSCWTEWDE